MGEELLRINFQQ